MGSLGGWNTHCHRSKSHRGLLDIVREDDVCRNQPVDRGERVEYRAPTSSLSQLAALYGVVTKRAFFFARAQNRENLLTKRYLSPITTFSPSGCQVFDARLDAFLRFAPRLPSCVNTGDKNEKCFNRE